MDLVLPNLFVPGAAKSGTSSLHEYLDQHPDIFMTKRKEPHFFSHEEHYTRGLSWYSSLFEEGRNCAYRGESSTGYMVFARVIERVKRDIPSPRFILILRNPVDRAWSHYRWLQGMGYEPDDFRTAFLRDMNEQPDADQFLGVGYKYYFQFGLYGKWLSKYIQAFGRSAIHIVTTEALGQAPLETINSCLSFLGLSPLQQLTTLTKNRSVRLRYPWLYRTVVAAVNSPGRTNVGPVLRASTSDGFRRRLSLAKRDLLLWLKGRLAFKAADEPLPTELRRWTADYYVSDVESLRIVTGMAFRAWGTDFPV